MKVLISTVLLIGSITFVTLQSNAQNSSVAIGDATPKANAVLYLKSPGGNQGLIIPIVSNTTSIPTPEAGMIVYNSGDKNVYYHNGSTWTVIGSVSGGGSTPTLSNGQLLTGNGTTNSASTIAGDATLSGGTITISNNAITSAKIADGTIAAADLNAMSATSGQVLKFNGTAWAPAADAGGVTYTGGTGITIVGAVITNTGDTNASDDITTASTATGDVTGVFSNLQIASGAVTTTEIANGTIAAADLSSMSATNGQILKYNGTSWVPSPDDVGGGATPTLSNGQLLTGNGTTNAASTLAGDATLSGGTITISNNSITSIKIVDGEVADADISSVAPGKITQAAATTGEVLKWNGTAWAPGADVGGSGTVTAVSIATANGFSGSSSGGATPALTIVAGAITPTSVTSTGTVTGSNLSGTNTGDNAANTLYSSLVSNATHTGDATGAVALQVRGINNVLMSGLGTGILKNTTSTGVPSIATGADLPAMTATVGGAVPTPPNNTTTFLRGDGTFATPSGGGTVTNVSGTLPISVATQTSTPVISISQASAVGNGYLSSADWVIFNGKGSGTVTSVGLTMPSVFTVASSPITSNGTIAVTYSGTALPVANGGTGRATWDGLLVGAGATINDIANGNPNEVLTMVGTTPSWQLPAASGWGLTGNTGTTFGTNFIGTTDNIGLSFKTNNQQRIAIDASGRLLINTPTGQTNAILDIVPNGAGIGNMVLRGSSVNPNDPVDIEFRNFTASTILGKIYMNPSASDMLFEANGATRLTLQNDGDVGIGTTNPVAKLDVAGTIKIADGTEALGKVLTSDANGLASWQAAGVGTGWTLTGNASTTVGTNFIGTTDNVGLSFKTNNLERIRVLGTGNVGIGTTAPVQMLEVAGNINIGNTNSYMINNLAVVTSNSTDGNIFVGTNSGLFNTAVSGTFLGTAAGRDNTTGTDNTFIGRNAGLVNAGGTLNVMVGSGSGQASKGSSNTFVGYRSGYLNVNGVRNTLIGREADVVSANLTNAIAIGYQAVVNASNKIRLGDDNITVIEGQVGFTAASDKRFKTDIKDIDEGLNFISKLRPVSYRMKNGDNRINWGFIAQDIESLVGTENSVLTIGGDSNRMLGLRYTDFIAPLVKSIQEQQAEIEELKTLIQALEAKLKKYENDENTELAVIREQIKKLSDAVGMEATAEKKK